jgi:hypothetical protein
MAVNEEALQHNADDARLAAIVPSNFYSFCDSNEALFVDFWCGKGWGRSRGSWARDR